MNTNFENFKVGDFITVLQGQRLNPLTGIFVGEGLSEQKEHEPRYDNSYKGDVLEVRAIDYPFCVLKNKSDNDNILTMDFRLTTFKKLSELYVKEAINVKESQ